MNREYEEARKLFALEENYTVEQLNARRIELLSNACKYTDRIMLGQKISAAYLWLKCYLDCLEGCEMETA